MRTNTLLRLAGEWRRFLAAERGNVMVTFALSLVPTVGLVGAAIDYSRANSVRSTMQSAADSTALAISRNAPGQTPSQLQSSAQSYFNALFTRPEAQNVGVTATYTSSGGSQVTVTASATVKTNFMGLMGYSQIPVGVSSTTKWGSSRLRVALALDNTGSMAQDGKLDALKTATKNLLTQLKSAASTNGDVYVSIIPFTHDVNVGASNVNATWLDWTEYGYCVDGWGNFSATRETKGKCTGSGKGYSWVTVSDKSYWTGCVTDRGGVSSPNPGSAGAGYDQIVDAPGGPSQSKFPAHLDASSYGFGSRQCPAQVIKGLSYDWTGMNSLVDGMSAAGSTNQPIGLVWAWQSLVGGGPLTAPTYDTDYEYQHIIILLSDGLNTENRWSGDGSNVSSAVDARMYDAANSGKGTCKNIKNAKINSKYAITIYAIQVNTGGDPTSTLLQSCASSADKFFLLTSASQIITTFDQIGTNLSRLRVAK